MKTAVAWVLVFGCCHSALAAPQRPFGGDAQGQRPSGILSQIFGELKEIRNDLQKAQQEQGRPFNPFGRVSGGGPPHHRHPLGGNRNPFGNRPRDEKPNRDGFDPNSQNPNGNNPPNNPQNPFQRPPGQNPRQNNPQQQQNNPAQQQNNQQQQNNPVEQQNNPQQQNSEQPNNPQTPVKPIEFFNGPKTNPNGKDEVPATFVAPPPSFEPKNDEGAAAPEGGKEDLIRKIIGAPCLGSVTANGSCKKEFAGE